MKFLANLKNHYFGMFFAILGFSGWVKKLPHGPSLFTVWRFLSGNDSQGPRAFVPGRGKVWKDLGHSIPSSN